VEGEEYLGVKIFRFYLKCTRCSGEFTIKTDPKNSDYACETGVSRNFEPWRERDQAIEEMKAKRDKEEEGDAMKALENRTVDSKIEMDILDALDEIKSLNAKNAKLDPEQVLELRLAAHQSADRLSEEEERQIQEAFGTSDTLLRRLDDEVDADSGVDLLKNSALLQPTKKEEASSLPTQNNKPKKRKSSPSLPSNNLTANHPALLPVFSVVAPKNSKKQKIEGSFKQPETVAKKEVAAESSEDDGCSLLGLDY